MSDLLSKILEKADKHNVKIYLVGGVVRDFLLKEKQGFDYDFIISKLDKDFLEDIGGELKIFDKFLTAKVLLSDLVFDFAVFRKETYVAPGSDPIVEPANLEQDLARRDFTINAMAIELTDFIASNDKIIDLFNGRKDLENRAIKVLHDKSFIDDPSRILRAYRYKKRINGVFEKHTKKLIEQSTLSSLTGYRGLNEVKRLISEENPKEIFIEMQKDNIFSDVQDLENLLISYFEDTDIQKLQKAIKKLKN